MAATRLHSYVSLSQVRSSALVRVRSVDFLRCSSRAVLCSRLFSLCSALFCVCVRDFIFVCRNWLWVYMFFYFFITAPPCVLM